MACRFRRSQAIRVEPEPPNRSSTQSPPLLLFTQRSFDQLDRLHGRVQAIGRRLLLLPQGRLGLVAVPGVALLCDVAVEDGLVLKLVSAMAPRERVLRPDDLAAHLEPSGFECVLKLPLDRRGVAYVNRRAWFHRRPVTGERATQESVEVRWLHPIAFNLQFLVGVTLVVDVVRRIGEDEVRAARLRRDVGPP